MGILSQTDSQEAVFVLGTENAPDVLTVSGDGVAPRHARVWIAKGRMQVEDLAGGTLVNGHPIEGRVEMGYPASVQMGELTVLVELKAVVANATPEVAVPESTPLKSGARADITIPQRMPTRGGTTPMGHPPDDKPSNKAPLTGEYTLVKEIARGGMGQIYCGEDPQLDSREGYG